MAINSVNKLLCVRMTLNNVIYISYLLPFERVRPLVPAILPLAVIDGGFVFVSVVVIHCSGVHLRYVPVPRFDYNQFNIRTYVIDPSTGKQAVYFIKSGVTSIPVSKATDIFSLSWQHIGLNICMDHTDDRHPERYRIEGEWNGGISIEVEEKQTSEISLQPFTTMESAVNYLVRPLTGFYQKSKRTGKFNISHPEVFPRMMQLKALKIDMLEEMQILSVGELLQPHNILYVPEAQFTIYLPPVNM
jgi:hypothetical protein